MSMRDIARFELPAEEAYLDDHLRRPARNFDAKLLQEPVTVLPCRPAVAMSPDATVREATHLMQKEHRGCVLITEDGTLRTKLTGIFTERDVLLKVIESGRNPVEVPLRDFMTQEPESLALDDHLARALNMMAVGGFRHLPVVDAQGCPVYVLSVRLIVQFLVESFPAEVLNLPPDFATEKFVPQHGA